MLTGLTVALLALTAAGGGTLLTLKRPTMDNNACHASPRKPYTPGDAYLVWRVRAGCDSRVCADKAAALDVLIEARDTVPAPDSVVMG